MSLNVVSLSNFKSASWSQDWTPQELAEFYRVEASLVRANIPIVTDHGRSDEGDPWFVFCNANTGEIIVHFARFDGTYVVASPALDNCARGRDFRALIEAQIASHPLVIPKAASGGKLFIHPAALLIVLVATCFFKLSQTTAAAGELHEAQPAHHEAQPAHPGVGSLSHSDSESQAVMLDERATAAVLAAIVTGIAWAQSHDFNLWSIDAALPTKFDVPSQDLSVSTLSVAASPFDAEGDNLFHAHSPAAARATPLQISGETRPQHRRDIARSVTPITIPRLARLSPASIRPRPLQPRRCRPRLDRLLLPEAPRYRPTATPYKLKSCRSAAQQSAA